MKLQHSLIVLTVSICTLTFPPTGSVVAQVSQSGTDNNVNFPVKTEKKATAYYESGVNKYKSGDMQGAIGDYDNAIRLIPANRSFAQSNSNTEYTSREVIAKDTITTSTLHSCIEFSGYITQKYMARQEEAIKTNQYAALSLTVKYGNSCSRKNIVRSCTNMTLLTSKNAIKDGMQNLKKNEYIYSDDNLSEMNAESCAKRNGNYTTFTKAIYQKSR